MRIMRHYMLEARHREYEKSFSNHRKDLFDIFINNGGNR